MTFVIEEVELDLPRAMEKEGRGTEVGRGKKENRRLYLHNMVPP